MGTRSCVQHIICAAGWLAVAGVFAGCAQPDTASNSEKFDLTSARLAPEPASPARGNAAGAKQVNAKHSLAVTANPYASAAAQRVLGRGGSAIDAAIAAQMVLGLVEPQSSGLGGGGFLLYWDAANGQLHSYDGRETAPLAADESLFMDAATGRPMSFPSAVVGGRSVGVPGMLHMLGRAHTEHGSLPWAGLFDDAIALAERGFVVSERLAALVERVPGLTARPQMANYLHPSGVPLPAGQNLQNAAYAGSLRSLAQTGAGALYAGKLAEAMLEAVNSDVNPGQLTVYDLLLYQSKRREPVCKIIFAHNFCGMGPPSSGATTVLGILAQLEQLQLQAPLAFANAGRSLDASALLAHAFIEASRLAFADRNKYLGDPDFVDVPVAGLLDSGYLAGRASQIDLGARSGNMPAGVPPGVDAAAFSAGVDRELPSTTHLTIVDAAGNILSMTTSIETAFGSRLMAGGFILNNQLTDFAFAPTDVDHNKVANRVQGGKRPVSSMSPFVVFDASGQPVLALGSPGGKSIIGYVARVLYEVVALQRPLSEAVAASHIIDTGKQLRLEPGLAPAVVEALEAMGHQPVMRAQTSGLHAIQKTADGWLGVADPRREGVAIGD